MKFKISWKKHELLQKPHTYYMTRAGTTAIYGELARCFGRGVLVLKEHILGIHRYKLIDNSSVAQRFVMQKLDYLIRKIDEKPSEKLSKIKKYIEANKIEKGFMRAIHEAITAYLPEDEAKYAIATLHQVIVESGFSKGGYVVYDPHENKIYLRDGTIDLGKLDDKTHSEICRKLKEYGLNIRETYYHMKNREIILKALLESSTPEEAERKYLQLHEKLLKTEKAYAEGFRDHVRREIYRTAQAGAVFHGFYSLMTRLPAMVVSLVSRIMGQAVRMLPVVGAVASIQYEAAQVAVGLGEEIRNRIEQGAYVIHSLPSTYLGETGKEIEKSYLAKLKK